MSPLPARLAGPFVSPGGSSWSRCWLAQLSSRRPASRIRLRDAPPFVLERMPERFESLWLVSLGCTCRRARLLPALPRADDARRSRASGVASVARAVERCARPFRARALGRRARVPCEGGRGRDRGVPRHRGNRRVGHGARNLGRAPRATSSHRRAMRHVVGADERCSRSRAPCSSVSTRRGIDPDLAYVVALWGPVLVRRVVVELVRRARAFCLRLRPRRKDPS